MQRGRRVRKGWKCWVAGSEQAERCLGCDGTGAVVFSGLVCFLLPLHHLGDSLKRSDTRMRPPEVRDNKILL